MCKKITILIFFLLFSAFCGLPVYFLSKYSFFALRYVLSGYLLFFVSVYLVYRHHRRLLDGLSFHREELLEQNNVVKKEISRCSSLKTALTEKIKNYQHLEKFTENLNNETSLENVCEIVVQEAFRLFGCKGNAMLYLANEKSRRLELSAVKKEEPLQQIKEKTGDFFDRWVLRHAQPLLIEAMADDFRFDLDKIRQEQSLRPIGSLISAPLATQTSILGLLRVDSPLARTFNTDDLRFLSIVADIAKLAVENALYFQHMQELSIRDGLTGIFLRRFAFQRFKEEVLRAQRQGFPLAFLMLDLDHFKSFNDKFGHMGGDIVLKKLAKTLKSFFNGPGAFVARYGGEEFCVVLPYVLKDEALKMADDFRKFVSAQEIILRREKVKITISIGVAVFPEHAKTCEDLIRCADEALLRAKEGGRDRVCL